MDLVSQVGVQIRDLLLQPSNVILDTTPDFRCSATEAVLLGGEHGRPRRLSQRDLTDDEINGRLRDQLKDYNDLDVEVTNRHLWGLRDAQELG